MKILVYCFVNSSTGYGHWYRSLALAQAAQQRGHAVYVASDRQPPPGLTHIPTRYNDIGSFATALNIVKPDWLITDIPHDPPMWIRTLAKCKILTLNGIGYNQADGADLRVIQGVADIELPGPQDKVPVLKGLEYVILRPEIAKYRDIPKGQDTFVWGGGADMLGLLNRFVLACPGTFATLIVGDMTPAPLVSGPCHSVVRVKADSLDMFEWMAGSKAACIAMGVAAWELSYLGLETTVFSATPLHLIFAQGMAKAGLIKAWPEVGLPGNEEMRDFIRSDFEITGQPPDLLGPKRIMEALEGYG
jgi:spore coat polysaccharide biosynthesis predicted glycosyltransferase SpsG